MTSRLEYLLTLIGLQSGTKAPVESPSTAPLRMTRHDALAEISYATQGPHKLQVIAALLRWSPDMLTSDQIELLRRNVRDRMLMFALTQRPRLPDSKLPVAVTKATVCAMHEHMGWTPCPTCNGRGKVAKKVPGQGLVDTVCLSCGGVGWRGWTKSKRARVMGIPWTTAARCRLEMAEFGAALLHSWSCEGVTAIRDMAGRRT